MKLINKDYAVDTAWSIEVYHGSAREVCEMLEDAPTVEAIPIEWIKEWVAEIKDHPAYTEKEKTLCIEEFEDMLGAWAERKEE